jgi:site-specific recombinase XerD
MQIVKTQKIYYNQQLRIRLISDNDDAEYVRLVRKLPDCRWSNCLNSWHTSNIRDHIPFLNRVFPASVRFYDISGSSLIPKVEEKPNEKRISIQRNESGNSMTLNFLYDHELTNFLKLLGAKPKNSNKHDWELINNIEINEKLNSYLEKTNYKIDILNKSAEKQLCINSKTKEFEFEDMFRQFLLSLNYEKRTIEQYVFNINRFLSETQPEVGLTIESIRDYIDEKTISCNYSRSYLNQQINSLKAYFRFVYGKKPGRMEIPRPKSISQEPTILTKKEVGRIIDLIPNLKHRTLINLISMTGITVSEAIMIKPGDVNFNEMRITIKGRKENSIRTLPLKYDLIQTIDLYLEQYRPNLYLFEGYKGKRFSERGIQKIIKKYAQKAGIRSKASVQTLRRSFASQLIDSGAEIKSVQEFLGHKCLRTTELYAQFSDLRDCRK